MNEPISIWRGASVAPFRSDNLAPPAPLDDPVRAEAVILGLIPYIDDMAALTRIYRAAADALMGASHGQRDPGDEDDGIVGGDGVS